MRGSVDYGDGFARPMEMCSGTIDCMKGGDVHVRDAAKAVASSGDVAMTILAARKQPSAGEGSIPSSVWF